MHRRWSVPLYAGHGFGKLWQPQCQLAGPVLAPACSVAQGPLPHGFWAAAGTFPVHSHPAQCWHQGQEDKELQQPPRAPSCAPAERDKWAGARLGLPWGTATSSHASRAPHFWLLPEMALSSSSNGHTTALSLSAGEGHCSAHCSL